MQYRRNSKRYDEQLADSRNTPHLKENTVIIVLSYFFSGINLIFAGGYCIKITEADYLKSLILVGAVMLMMVPISIFDNRRKMRGKLACILGCIMHLACCIMLSYILSLWWMAVYVCEILLCILAIIVARKF